MTRRRRSTVRPPESFDRDIVGFFDTHIQTNELGKPLRLAPHQREILAAAFDFDAHGRLGWDTMIWSCLKKDGKTTINSGTSTFWQYTQEPPNEQATVANDQEQAEARAFRTKRRLIELNATLAAQALVLDKWRIVTANETEDRALAHEYAGSAGANIGFSSWDELWAFVSENSTRLWEEFTSVPTRTNSIRFVTSYAGIINESKVLWPLYLQGVGPEEHPDGQGVRIHKTLPLYYNEKARLLVYWDHVPRMPWQSAAKIAAQTQGLRPGTVARFWRNEWSASATVFVTPELLDGVTDRSHAPIARQKTLVVYVGVDAATRGDFCAMVMIARGHDGTFVLIQYRLWKPQPGQPIDLELTVERTIFEWAQDFTIGAIYCDPLQLASTGSRVRRAGLPFEDFPQTTAGTTRMGQVLYDALQNRTLRLYPDDELRTQMLNVQAIESPRGFRLAKVSSSRKIDLVAALTLAMIAALDAVPEGHIITAEEEAEMSWQEQRFMRAAGFEIPREHEVVDDEAHWERDDDLSAWAWRRFDGERWHSLW